MTSLTRKEAQTRSSAITVNAYDVALDLTGPTPHFRSITSIRFTAREPGGATFVDVAAVEVRRAVLNGRDVGAGLNGRRLRLSGLAADNELVVDAVMAYSHDGEGLHRHVDPADDRVYLYAMSFLDAAPRWFACFDQPDLKAPVTLDVRCPDEWTVAGNGPATRLGPGHWRLAPTGPLAPYFTTVIAGPYHSVRDVHDGIRLGLHVRASLAEHLDAAAPDLLAHTKKCLDGLHATFATRYPWGEYHQAFVPEFNAGAMENPGCVVLRDDFIHRSRATDAQLADRRVTIAHEMAHMWFGDLVTMRWWDDLWLNESFAEYLGHRVSGAQTWAAFGIERKSWGYAADRRPSTHPVAGNGAVDAAGALNDFDGISYAKGASVLRQLAGQLGDEVFIGGLRAYIRTHAHGNAEFADLLAAWTAAGARDLDAWAAAWLRTSGLDTLEFADGTLVRHAPGDIARPHAVHAAAYDADGVELDRRSLLITGERTPCPLSGALVLPDADDETWAKIALPPAVVPTLGPVLAGLTDARARVAIWNALILAVADAEVAPAAAGALVVAALPSEPDDAVLTVVGRWTVDWLLGRLLTGAARDELRQRVAAAALAAGQAAAPASGRQLALVRIAAALTADTARLRSWEHGEQLPDGVEPDVEFGWLVRRRRAELGDLSGADIEAAATADPSAAGRVHAVRCHVARPDPLAKKQFWTILMTEAQRANYELYAIAEGFWVPGQEELTAPYAERYFTEVAATAQLRTGWVVDRLAQLAYPWTAVDAATLDAGARLLATADLAPGIRRVVLDAGDDLRRSLAVRARFA